MRLTILAMLLWLHCSLLLATPPFRVVVFLADACPICQKYAPTLRSLQEKYAPSGVEFIGIFPDSYTTDAEISTFAISHPCGFTMRRDSAQVLATKLKARITPEVFILSATGKTLYRGRIDNEFPALGKRRSIITERNLDEALDALTHEKFVKTKRTQAIGCYIEFTH